MKKIFKTPLTGFLDIALIMAITIVAVKFLGPIILQSDTEDDKQMSYTTMFEYACDETGRIIKDMLIDEFGNTYGWIDIKYHDNGNFEEVTENNERDRLIRNVHYGIDGEFLYWFEIRYDENGNEVSVIKFDQFGNIVEQ